MKLSRAVPILTVSDLAESVRSYRAALGLDILMDLGWIVTLGSGGAAQFSLTEHDLTAPLNPAVSLDVEDVELAFAQVIAEGLEVVHPLSDESWGVRRFFFRDGSGNVVNVLSHADLASRSQG